MYHTFRLHRSVGYESTFRMSLSVVHSCSVVVIMASKLCLPSQKDIERLLEDSASGDDDVSSESDKCPEFESVQAGYA